MGCRNKQQRYLEALSQASRDPFSNNEDFHIVEDKPESGNDMLDIDIESFSSLIQSNLINSPLYYYGDSDGTDQRRRTDISKAKF